MYPEPITCFYETARSPRDHIHLAFKVKLQQVIFSGCDVAWEGDGDERRETCTWYEYFSHKSCCCFSFPSLFRHSAAFHRTVAKASCHRLLSCFFLQHIGERPRITRTVQTHWLYLIKGEWPVLSNPSSASLVAETNIEMAWRAFREGASEYVLVMIMTMLLMLLSVGTQSSL